MNYIFIFFLLIASIFGILWLQWEQKVERVDGLIARTLQDFCGTFQSIPRKKYNKRCGLSFKLEILRFSPFFPMFGNELWMAKEAILDDNKDG